MSALSMFVHTRFKIILIHYVRFAKLVKVPLGSNLIQNVHHFLVKPRNHWPKSAKSCGSVGPVCDPWSQIKLTVYALIMLLKFLFKSIVSFKDAKVRSRCFGFSHFARHHLRNSLQNNSIPRLLQLT